MGLLKCGKQGWFADVMNIQESPPDISHREGTNCYHRLIFLPLFTFIGNLCHFLERQQQRKNVDLPERSSLIMTSKNHMFPSSKKGIP